MEKRRECGKVKEKTGAGERRDTERQSLLNGEIRGMASSSIARTQMVKAARAQGGKPSCMATS